ncbi:MAG TPA: hypothetical protein VG713_14135 [Pirellulales bacterium]|nr:hypothetical protein [Pirellulales bacterium]
MTCGYIILRAMSRLAQSRGLKPWLCSQPLKQPRGLKQVLDVRPIDIRQRRGSRSRVD